MAASSLVDLVKIYATNQGTGALTLGEAVQGYRGVEALMNGATYSYSIQQDAQWEIGKATFLAVDNQLVRTPTDSSNGGGAVDFQANAAIAFVALSEDILARDVLQPLYGFGPPLPGQGLIGQTYTDLTRPVTLYGPKTASGWGSGVNLQGAPGTAASYETIEELRAADPAALFYVLLGPTGGTNYALVSGDFTGRVDNTDVIKLNAVPLTTGALKRQSGASVSFIGRGENAVPTNLEKIGQAAIRAVDYGADPTGVVDSTIALTEAAADAVKLGRELEMPGVFLVSQWKLPGTLPDTSRYLKLSGDFTLVQAVPNLPCVMIQDDPLQTSVGYEFSCVLVPHVDSDRENDANCGIDLTGFSGAKIKVTLGVASAVTARTGRFRDLVFARSNVPFHYTNDVYIYGNNVPAPKCMYRASNGGTGAPGNPNLNKLSGWIGYLTGLQPGDIMVDVGDTTQQTIADMLFESIPGATCIRAGNFCTIKHNWFEAGAGSIDIKFVSTNSTTPNNGVIGRNQFSGSGHVIQYQNGLGAPPVIEFCLDDLAVSYIDEGGSPVPPPASIRGFPQPPGPSAFTHLAGPGAFSAVVDVAPSPRFRVDHHGNTTHFLSLAVTPSATGESVARLSIAPGTAIVSVTYGMRDVTTGRQIPWGMGDNPDGQNSGGFFETINPHRLNINVTTRVVP